MKNDNEVARDYGYEIDTYGDRFVLRPFDGGSDYLGVEGIFFDSVDEALDALYVAEEDHYDEYDDGQPTEYEEWQDLPYGGDDCYDYDMYM